MTNVQAKMIGHVRIVDDLNNILLDKTNAIHPQNIARLWARALSNESNSYIHRIAFGNGGTTRDSSGVVIMKPVNDGQGSDGHTWDSRLYNETYSEIINEGATTLNEDLGVDPGSAGHDNVRPGRKNSPNQDGTSVVHVSGPGVRSIENGTLSQVIITCIINTSEPDGQANNINDASDMFVFDEIGLYSPGSPGANTRGYQDIDVGNNITADSNTNLASNTIYSFKVYVDNSSTAQTISFRTPNTGSGTAGAITYGDLCEILNAGVAGSSIRPKGSTVTITSTTETYPTLIGAYTAGKLRFKSGTEGSTSAIYLADASVFLAALPTSGTAIPDTPVSGIDAGVQNNSVEPLKERERLLTHIIFDPVAKAADRSLTITYTLNLIVDRSE
jgi:hypothetical protein